MSASAGGWFVILLALACANLPFVNQRLFAVIPLGKPRKPFWARLAELIVYYLLVGAVGFAVEDFSALTYVRRKARETGLFDLLDMVADPDDPRDLFGMLQRARP